jgi:hypothetical protein
MHEHRVVKEPAFGCSSARNLRNGLIKNPRTTFRVTESVRAMPFQDHFLQHVLANYCLNKAGCGKTVLMYENSYLLRLNIERASLITLIIGDM